jgi:electron transport complex protein RnfC
MTIDTDYMISGIKYLQKYIGIGKVILGIEDNKPEAIELFRKRASEIENFEVRALPSMYPQGGEKVLIYNTTGRIVAAGQLPLDQGCVVINVTTLAFIGKYMETGMPLVEKCVTVDGSAVKTPGKVIAPIGTSIKDVIEALGGYKTTPKKILMGGPMMGMAQPTDSNPVVKNTNGILAFSAKDAVIPEETECINCGRCVNACPLRLMPVRIARALKRKNIDELRELNANLCMECGCCSFVCPAKRDLVQNHKLAKAMIPRK